MFREQSHIFMIVLNGLVYRFECLRLVNCRGSFLDVKDGQWAILQEWMFWFSMGSGGSAPDFLSFCF